MKVNRYNFGKPSKLVGELEQRLSAWLRTGLALSTRNCRGVFAHEVKFTYGLLENSRPADALARLPAATVAFQLTLIPQVTTLLAFSRATVLALVSGLLGDVTPAALADRELTPVDESLWQYFLQSYLLPALKETWTADASLDLALNRRELNPQYTRIFAHSGNLVVCSLGVEGVPGAESGQWLLPLKTIASLFGIAARQTGERRGEVEQSPLMPTLVKELPVEISVVLGTSDVSLSQLARLSVGDMVVLNQRVAEPLTGSVGNEPMLRGWPGRVGPWKAFQIHSLTSTG